MADIFLSYAREDEAVARDLAHVLESYGWRVFWDRTIPAGSDWRSRIGQALADARCVLVLWSRRSVLSQWVIQEAEEGLYRRVLIPVLIDSTVAQQPLGFRHLQFADLAGKAMDARLPELARLVADIAALLRAPPAVPPQVEEAAQPVKRPLVSVSVSVPGPEAAAATPVAPSWADVEARYRQHLQRTLGRTRLLGADDEVDIESLFTDVYFLPQASASHRYGAASSSFSDFSQLMDKRQEERCNAFDALNSSDRLYILGTPGAGKSTFLRHVAASAAAGRLPGLPFFVSIKDWADAGSTLFEELARPLHELGWVDAREAVQARLVSGEAMLLLDGLDEVRLQGGKREGIVKAIVETAARYPKARMLLTCRTSANDHAFDGFRYLEVADFLPEQQTTFVRKWYAANPDKGDLFLEQYTANQSRALRDLGRKPLFLAFLCIAFDQAMEFPRSRSALYAEAIDVLLTKWDSTRKIQRESYGLQGAERKKQFLAQLAFRTFELDQYAISEMMISVVLSRFLQRLPDGHRYDAIDSAGLARSLEAAHGILVERAEGVFAFSHLSVHEYFAALGLVNAVAGGRSWTELVPHEALVVGRWREVLLHTGTALHDGDAYLAHLRVCLKRLLAVLPLARQLIERCSYIAGNDDMFNECSRDAPRYLKRFAGNDAFQLDFYPTQRLSSAVSRVERSLLFSLRRYRESQNPAPASLMDAWRRLEVLRETLAFKHGVSLLIGKGLLGGLDEFDEQLATFIDTQDMMLILLDDVMVQDRERLRRLLMDSGW